MLSICVSEAMKKYLIPVAAVAVAAALGTPYYLGIKAEESLTAQQKLLQESGFLTVESHQYERGWFSATETTVIRLKPFELAQPTATTPSR